MLLTNFFHALFLAILDFLGLMDKIQADFFTMLVALCLKKTVNKRFASYFPITENHFFYSYF